MIEASATMSDSELVTRTREGDREAFGELVERYQRRVWLVCRQYLSREDATCAAQQSWVKAFTKIDRFDGRSAFTTWITRIAINTCLDELRRQKREGLRVEETGDSDGNEPIMAVEDFQPSPETRAMQREATQQVRSFEAELSQQQRQVFKLRFYAELDLEEIAGVLGVHIGTVKTQLHRAVHRLRRELGDLR
ncbi:MAG: sigma-70 family RNA polymerase sigma factor [bacterium]|nr:sigma-70 family RNA polymerase sigma factor [bacterium]